MQNYTTTQIMPSLTLAEALRIAGTVMNPDRTMGIELECYVPNKRAFADLMAQAGLSVCLESWSSGRTPSADWVITTDGSLSSMRGYDDVEIKCAPMKAEALVKDLHILCGLFTQVDAKVNRTCGHHIHHSQDDFKQKHLCYLANLYVKNEVALDQMLPESRRANNAHYCGSIRTRLESLIRGNTGQLNETSAGNPNRRNQDGTLAVNMDWADRNIIANSRSLKVNFKSMHRGYRTVEFRHHSGTTDFAKLVLWMAMTQAMMMRALTGKVTKTNVTSGKGFRDNNIYNLMLSNGWATAKGGILYAKSINHWKLLQMVQARYTEFGFKSYKLARFDEPLPELSGNNAKRVAHKAIIALRRHLTEQVVYNADNEGTRAFIAELVDFELEQEIVNSLNL
jgi:hypothetical protein